MNSPSGSCLFRFSSAAALLMLPLFLVGCDPEQRQSAWRFLTFSTPLVRDMVVSAVLLGINCGMLGSFLVVRRMALAADTLSHAVLPGIVGGFLWNMTKEPTALLVGAIVAGVLASLLMNAITSSTKLKTDAAQGIILTVFFALGICLYATLPSGNKAGLQRFLFGQLAAVDSQDVRWLFWSCLLSGIFIVLTFPRLLLLSFDPTFGRVMGLPLTVLHYALMLLTTLAIIVSMQAVGVVLVSAMLITPASAASLLSHRLGRMILCAAGIGVVAAVGGTFLSFVGKKWATGPTIVLCAAALFALAHFFSPQRGVFVRWQSRWRRASQIRSENSLKAIYRWLEDRPDHAPREAMPLERIASDLGLAPSVLRRQINHLRRQGFAESAPGHDAAFLLTDSGWREARKITRKHRLWELYLTKRAHYESDHVHEDAERVEHFLTDENMRRLEEILDFPTRDPHGRPIPAMDDASDSSARVGNAG